MNFPLDLRFKILAIASQIYVRDSMGHLICYVKQKAFKLKEAVTVYADEAQTIALYRIEADRILDISAKYRIEDMDGREIGTLTRRGMKSLWRAHYEVHRGGTLALTIQEENPWVKLIDGFLGEIPIINMLTGYFLHPAYRISRADTGAVALRAKKQPAFFEGRFTIDAVGAASDDDQLLGVLSILMALMLERSRG
jgi:hypothetical protein